MSSTGARRAEQSYHYPGFCTYVLGLEMYDVPPTEDLHLLCRGAPLNDSLDLFSFLDLPHSRLGS